MKLNRGDSAERNSEGNALKLDRAISAERNSEGNAFEFSKGDRGET
ncbi:MAG: hypothetical protein KME13_08810 [Myxacorys californica WJT36-NPBG1]|nr:hypothetical protein [Myxacorys californica WJT36-NPBG1]